MPVGQESVDPVLRGIVVKKHRAVVGEIPVAMAIDAGIAAVGILPDDIASRAHQNTQLEESKLILETLMAEMLRPNVLV